MINPEPRTSTCAGSPLHSELRGAQNGHLVGVRRRLALRPLNYAAPTADGFPSFHFRRTKAGPMISIRSVQMLPEYPGGVVICPPPGTIPPKAGVPESASGNDVESQNRLRR